MDIELRKLLKELSSHVLKILAKNENLPNGKQCSCADKLKDISKKLCEFDKALETSLKPQTIETAHVAQEESKTNESHQSSTRRKIVKDIPPKSTDSNVATNDSSRSQRYAARTKIVESTRESLPAETIAVRASKRPPMPNPKYDVKIKLRRIDKEPSNRRRDSADYRPASMEPLVDNIPTESTQNGLRSRYEKAMEKRASKLRKTIAFERPITDENERNAEKNTNRNMYHANTLYKSLCNLCDIRTEKNDLRMVLHYVKHHPEHEVFISRPSPTYADVIRTQSQTFELYKGKISGLCFFCEEVKTLHKSGYAAHILTHTGEPFYFCTGCNTPFKKKLSHPKCGLLHFETIYESNGSNGAVEGFMCKECNYLQIGEQKLVNHLTSQHDYSSLEVNEHYEKVTLIPDLSHVKATVKYAFIEPETLFKCTICKAQSTDFEEFERHITDDHGNIKEYVCCCKQKLKFNGYNHLTVFAHFFDHYANLYRCMSCKNNNGNIYYRQEGILNHISTEHTKDACKFQHIHRQTEQTIATEIQFLKFICNVCEQELVHMHDALNHFKANHPTQITDINILVSKKTTTMTEQFGKTRTKYVGSQEYVLRQSFLCTQCNHESTSKEDLLAHYNVDHEMSMFEMKPGLTLLMPMESSTAKCEKINEKFDRFTMYSCYQCYENNEGNNVIYGTADEVHNHWLEMHSSTGHPFRFYIETLVQCNYCNVISTYKGMLQHISQFHSNSPICFVDVNVYNKCPLCDYSCDAMDNLSTHFQEEHSLILEVNMTNPNRLTDEQFQRLLKIDVYKKPMCDHCGEIFDFEEAFNTHHGLKHKNEIKRSRNVIDNAYKGLVSACCDQFVRPQDFYSHLSVHSFEFSCQLCNVTMKNLEGAVEHDLIKHEFDDDSFEYRCKSLNRTLRKMFFRTKVFFGNGLVLYKHNLLGTRHDDSEVFDSFLRAKNNSYKNAINKMMETNSYSS